MSDPGLRRRIEDFLAEGPWAVVGASTDRSKYGNKVLRCYQQDERSPLYPIHRHEREVEGLAAYRDLASTPELARAVSIITPPAISATVVEQAAELGIRRLWLQPGAEDDEVLERAEQAGIACIAGGPCLLVVLGFRE